MEKQRDSNTSIAWMVAEFVLICALIATVPLCVYIDTNVIGEAMSEESLTEFLHNVYAITAAVCFYSGAVRLPAQRGFLVLAGTLFAVLSIRELDFLFDNIWQGFWLYPALAVLASGVVIARRNPGTVSGPLLRYLAGREATFVYLGFALLIVFTRLFGTGDLWEGVMKENYDPRVKAAIQEGLELLSYTLIAYGSVMSLRAGFAGSHRAG